MTTSVGALRRKGKSKAARQGRHALPPSPVLNRYQAAPSMTDQYAMYVKRVNRWRDQLNPLRGLTVQRAIAYLEAGKRGEYADLQWLFEHIEESDPTLIALVERYEGGLAGMDFKFHQVPEAEIPKNGSTQLAEEQAAALREAYDGIDNLREAINFLMLARFRGYSHLEKHINPDGDVFHLEPVDQWYWVRDGINGVWQYNEQARSGTYRGIDVPDLRERFIVREKKRPVNRLGLLYYVYRNLGLKDWAGFVETFGIPPIFLIQPPNIDPNKAAEYQAIAEAIMADARGSLPNGSDVKSVDAGARNQNPFRDFLTFLKEELVLAGTGGKLTMLAESGSGTLAGGAHQDAWDEIVAGEASAISELLQKQFDAFILEKEFSGRPVLACFELGRGDEEEDEKAFKRDVWKGFLTDKTVADVMANLVSIRELTTQVGLPLNEEYTEPYLPVTTENGQVVTGDVVRDAQNDIVGGDAAPNPTAGPEGEAGTGPAGTPALPARHARVVPYSNSFRSGTSPVNPKLLSNATNDLARAVASDLQPVLKRIAAIVQIEDPEILRNRLTVFLADLQRLKTDISADPEAARALQEAMGAALVNGLSKKGTKP